MERIRANKAYYIIILLTVICLAFILRVPSHAAGEVAPITELKEKLENISEEEAAVLSELFSLEQEIAALEADELRISDEINQLQRSILDLEKSIQEKQEAYDNQCEILKQVLVNYQRRGPASYIEILLRAKDFSSFIKSLNIIKDISHNTNELLEELKEGQKQLNEKKASLETENALLEQKRTELANDIHKKMQLQQQKEEYLASLKQDGEYYRIQLELVSGMWENCKKLFSEMSKDIADIINAGLFAVDDLNLKLGFFNISGYIEEETFNRVLSDNSNLTETVFEFEEGRVKIEVPSERLLLIGNFVITGKSEVTFEAEEGYFYDLPLEKSSIDEIFMNGPLTINFDLIADDIIVIDFKITDVTSNDGTLDFVVVPQF